MQSPFRNDKNHWTTDFMIWRHTTLTAQTRCNRRGSFSSFTRSAPMSFAAQSSLTSGECLSVQVSKFDWTFQPIIGANSDQIRIRIAIPPAKCNATVHRYRDVYRGAFHCIARHPQHQQSLSVYRSISRWVVLAGRLSRWGLKFFLLLLLLLHSIHTNSSGNSHIPLNLELFDSLSLCTLERKREM